MTDEQINVEIAKACGWVDKGSVNYDRPDDHLFKRIKPNSWECEHSWQHEFNYCTDLNAMHEAEKKLLRYHGAWETYGNKLICMFGCGAFAAPARQRAEAFLRTLGKWQEATGKDSLTVGGATTEQSSVDQKEVQK